MALKCDFKLTVTCRNVSIFFTVGASKCKRASARAKNAITGLQICLLDALLKPDLKINQPR